MCFSCRLKIATLPAARISFGCWFHSFGAQALNHRHRRFSCWFSARRVSSWLWISFFVVGHTLSAFPSGNRVQFHANTCTPGAQSWIQFFSWLVTSVVPLVLEWCGHTSLWAWPLWQRYFVLSGAYILALQVFHIEVFCSSRISRLPGIWLHF